MRHITRCDKRESSLVTAAPDERVERSECERVGAERSRWHTVLTILYATRIWSHSVVILSNLLGAVLALHLRRLAGNEGDDEALLNAGTSTTADLSGGQREGVLIDSKTEHASAGVCWWTLFWACLATVFSLGGCCLFDSYFDYVKGYDTPEGATDRTLIDRHVQPHQVVSVAVLLYVLAIPANVAAEMGGRAPYWLGLLFAGGLLASFNYTALLELKYNALGDLHNAICVGPLVTLYSFVAQGGDLRGHWLDVLLYSVPPALQIGMITYSNNVRDRAMDERSMVTLATSLGERCAERFWWMLLALPHVLLASVSFAVRSPSLALPLLAVPIAAFAGARFLRRDWRALPKQMARVHGVSTALYCIALHLHLRAR